MSMMIMFGGETSDSFSATEQHIINKLRRRNVGADIFAGNIQEVFSFAFKLLFTCSTYAQEVK